MTTPDRGRHRSPQPRPPLLARPTVRIAVIATAAGVLTVAALAGIANNVGDGFTPAAHTSPAMPSPADDDPGQRGMRGLPTPARIFDVPAAGDPQPWSEGDGSLHGACRCTPRTPFVALSEPVWASRAVLVSQSPSTLAAVTSQQISETRETTTTTAETTATDTTAAASSSPTATDTQEEDDMPQPTLPSDIGELVEEVAE